MAREAPRLGITTGARYRTVPEAQIVEHLAINGWACQLRNGARAAVLPEVRGALEACVQAGLPFEGGPGGERCFDPAEVMNAIKWAWMHRGDPLCRERFIATGRALVCEFHAAADAHGMPPPPATLEPQRFSVTLERTFNVQGFPAGKSFRLRLPLPLEGPALGGLQILNRRSSAMDAEFTVGAGRLDARLLSPSDGMVTLGADLSFVASPTVPTPGQATLAADEAELYTRPSEGLIQVDARIQDLAATLAGSAREPWTVVRRFWRFMHDELICGVVHYDELGAGNPITRVLDSRWYDCQLGSALLIALCRARGIPARMASGYVLYSASPFNHYWLEVWIGDRGWVPLDLFCAGLWDTGPTDPWRDYFLGALDYRMQTERLPRLFAGSPTLRFPASWHRLTRSLEDGIEIGVFETGSGVLVYHDRISARRLAP